MNVYFFRPDVYARLYNCSAFTREEWFEFGTPYPLVGAAVIVLGIVLEMIYLPFVITMLQPKFLDNSCYKLMFVLGVQDVVAIYDGGILTGYLTMQGAVFCTHPNLIYFTGLLGLALWCTSCSTCILLTFNRLVDVYLPGLSYTLFNGWRTWLWTIVPIAIFFWVIFFETALIFNSRYMSWFFYPYYGMGLDVDQTLYPFTFHVINNFTVIIILCTGNALLYRHVIVTTRSGFTSSTAKMQRKLLLQVGIICLLNVIASTIYVFIQFVMSPPWLTLLGSMTYTLNTGALAITYILLNETLRRATLAAILPRAVLARFGKTSIVDAPLNSVTQQHTTYPRRSGWCGGRVTLRQRPPPPGSVLFGRFARLTK